MAQLTFYISKASQPLTVTFVDDNWTLEHRLNPKDDAILVTLRYAKRKIDQQDEQPSAVVSMLKKYEIARRFIRSQLRTAALVLYSHPSLSTEILDFVRPLIEQPPSFQHERDQASLITGQIGCNDEIHAGCPVLPVSATELDSFVKRSLDAAWTFRADYQRFVDKQDPTEQIEAARSAAARMESLILDQDAVVEEARISWYDAKASQKEAHSNVLV